MKTVKILTVTLILFSSGYVFAGDVQGTIEPIIPGRRVEITCDGGNDYTTDTDDRGTYRVYIPKSGNCKIIVEHDDEKTASFEFRVSNRLKRLDLTVEGEKGDYALRRN